jgi:Ni,Fe-hydrogenase I small subunit
MTEIHRGISVEDLITDFPQSIKFMVQEGLPCFVCGEPTWGTFEEMARKKGMTEAEIDLLIEQMKAHFAMKRT